MSNPVTDRNLLFGILALQMDFIDRDALIRAMNAWVLAKSRTLGEILLEQKALDADTRALLEALMQKHLARHGGDAEKASRLRQLRRPAKAASRATVPVNQRHGGGQPAGDLLCLFRR